MLCNKISWKFRFQPLAVKYELSISRPHKVLSIKKVLMSGTRKKMEERLENARRLVNEDPERL